jgi:pyridoxine 5-phosphate synthase
VRAARVAADAGADGITAHLREDRRHISDDDIERLVREIDLPLNFEMAATEEMLVIALKHKPHAACIVPEKRVEVTTEGGLDAAGQHNRLKHYCDELGAAGCRVSLFIEADRRQMEAAASLGAPVVEIHAGAYCDADPDRQAYELARIVEAARTAEDIGLECHVGHGLTFENVAPIAAIPSVAELNIGHFLVGEAVFGGLESSIKRMRAIMDNARAEAAGRASA